MSDLLEGAIAAGTIATAVAAVWGLRSASATARTAQQELAAQWQPLLIDVPSAEDAEQDRSLRLPNGRRIEIPDGAPTPPAGGAIVQATGEHGDYVAVPFRNVGSGVGRVIELSLLVDGSETQARGRVEQQFLAPNEATRAVLSLPSDSPARGRFINCARQLGSGIAVGVAYSDLSGKTRGEVIFDLAREIDRGWHVANVVHLVLPSPLRKTAEQG